MAIKQLGLGCLILGLLGLGLTSCSGDSAGSGSEDTSSETSSSSAQTDSGSETESMETQSDTETDTETASSSASSTETQTETLTEGTDTGTETATDTETDTETGSESETEVMMSLLDVIPAAASREVETAVTVLGYGILVGAAINLTNCDTSDVIDVTSWSTVAQDGQSISIVLPADASRVQGLYTRNRSPHPCQALSA